MGNQPYDRTVTVDDSDALPSGIINELQDINAADRRTYFKRQVFPTCWVSSGAAPVLVANPGAGAPVPVWQIPTGVTVNARIPFEPGEMIAGNASPTTPPLINGVGFFYEAYGDGVTDFVISVIYAPGDPGVLNALGTLTGQVTLGSDNRLNHAASWTTTGINIANLVTLTDIGVLYVKIVTSGGGSGIHLGNLQPQYVR